jgi:uncharacterized Zn finger protein
MAPEGTEPTEDDRAPLPARGRLSAATLWCDACGRETAHRVLRVRGSRAVPDGHVVGVARCRECRWTHPFDSAAPETVAVRLIASAGRTSRRSIVPMGPSTVLEVDAVVPGLTPPHRIRRLDGTDGRPRERALARETAAVWAVRDAGAVVPVSVVEGAVTRAGRIELPPDRRLEIGGAISLAGTPLVIVGLRARGRTWRLPGDGFPASEVQRVYGRRTDRPPAGRRDWSTGRGIPRSRTSSVSRADRSRSSPGVRRTSTRPWARTADSGATVQRSSAPSRIDPSASSSGTSRTKFLVPWITHAPFGTNSPVAAAFDTWSGFTQNADPDASPALHAFE